VSDFELGLAFGSLVGAGAAIVMQLAVDAVLRMMK